MSRAENSLSYMRLYVRDWEGSERVIKMSLAEEGLYFRLCRRCFVHGSIPRDPDEIAAVIRVSREEFDRAWPAVEACFHEDPKNPSRLVNPRASEERRRSIRESQLQRRRAVAGWKGRKPRHSRGNAPALDGQSTGNANKNKNKSRNKNKNTTAEEGAVSRVWDKYPRKVDRTSAAKKIVGLLRAGVPEEQLSLAAERYALHMSRVGREKDKIKHGGTFFGPAEHWKDYADDKQWAEIEKECGGDSSPYAEKKYCERCKEQYVPATGVSGCPRCAKREDEDEAFGGSTAQP